MNVKDEEKTTGSLHGADGVGAEKVFVDNASTVSNERFATTSAQHRTLESYHVNLIAIGGTIGTAIFVYIGAGLTAGGPLMLLLAYIYWASVIFMIAELQKEMVCLWPTDVAFARNASRYIDDAAGFAAGYNFWISQVALAIFEIVAFGVVIGFWESTRRISAAVFISILIVAYIALNIWNTRFFGNAEFGFAIGKVLLITGLLLFTFIAMLGGNPLHDRFGFRYWKNPGRSNLRRDRPEEVGMITTPYPDHPTGVGKFEGYLACLTNAAFTMAGPDYLSMVAGEARNPRRTMHRAFNSTIYRLIIFFIGTVLAVGVLCPYNDSGLISAQKASAPGGARSPYVIAMNRMMIPVLPHIVNGLILTSVFSAGNAYIFTSSRGLAQMARDGQAPKLFARRNRNGVPSIAVGFCMLLCLLSYCQVSTSAQVVIKYLTNLVASSQLVNWILLAFTWIRFNAAHKAQGISRDSLPVRSHFLPFGTSLIKDLVKRPLEFTTDQLVFWVCVGAWYAFISSIFVLLMQGYYVFLSGAWDISAFLFAYMMPILFIALYLGWKILKRTRFYRASEVDILSFKYDAEFTEHIEYDQERSKVGLLVHRALSTMF
ncbi:BZ3500_MvSof-1268-A1-R1_Chr6-3g08930 [Microbotryum saponariae]|uniref:BZ3500_MvSof-1268-A1-R1_Chr6-3g08930 protein n=1 Tax=Microbotryum saponariae TaxID=289078 RepID=A0A2X0L539_9BASI|nr:BZ3500_MvSof-1268-A1-R1_Chr6-3g08930 [Microbotryum saponariae]SDA07532.1 BZ3501_MvSof-1269-A2-R1_Chr6-2g08634 [Microbotryum saponariae]